MIAEKPSQEQLSPAINHTNPLRRAAIFGSLERVEVVFGNGRRELISKCTQLYPAVVDETNFAQHAPSLGEIEVIFSTWGMPALRPEQLDLMPKLKAVFYAAGTVQSFARPLLERGILVTSAWRANAIPVSEFTLGQILLATKSYFRNCRGFTHPGLSRAPHWGRGNFGETIAILGAGAIGKRVIELLSPFDLKVIVFDPFLSQESAKALGAAKVSLETAFEEGYVVSNHLASLPQTVGMLNGELFRRMRPSATFINTGRGATVDEPGLIEVLRGRPDITALLDVTEPEPPVLGSPLFSLSNVYLTPHIAGSTGDEMNRLADFCLEDFRAWEAAKPLQNAVTLSMLETMA